MQYYCTILVLNTEVYFYISGFVLRMHIYLGLYSFDLRHTRVYSITVMVHV